MALSRKQWLESGAPFETTVRGRRRRVFTGSSAPLLPPYLLLISDLYKIQADTITITAPRNINGCRLASYFSQTTPGNRGWHIAATWPLTHNNLRLGSPFNPLIYYIMFWA